MPLALLAALTTFSVTLQVRAQPLSLLLPALSQRLGRTLTVQPTLAREQIVIDVKNVEPDMLLTRIAEVTHAEWVLKGEEFRLERSPERERSLIEAENRFHIEDLTAGWKRALVTPYSAAEEARRYLARRSKPIQERGSAGVHPVERYLNELLLHIPAESIVRLRGGQSLRFSNRPNAIFRPFPASAAPVLSRFLKDQETFSSITGPITEEETADTVPHRVVLTINAQRWSPGELNLWVSAGLEDKAGDIYAERQFDYCSAKGIDFSALPRQAPVSLTPFTLEMERLFADVGRLGSSRSVPLVEASPAVRDAVLNLERDGRLSRVWSEVLFALAARDSQPLVANLPDWAETYDPPEDGQTIEAYLALLSGFELRREGGWLALRPTFPGPAGSFRIDRAVAGGAVRAVFAGRCLSLDEATPIVERLGDLDLLVSMRTEIADITGGAASSPLDNHVYELKLLRSLPPATRGALFAGQKLPFRRLPPQVQAQLREIYIQDRPFEIDHESPDAQADAQQVESLILEGSEKRELAFIVRRTPTSSDRFLSAASRLVRYLDDDLKILKTEEDPNPETARFRVLTQRTIDLTVTFPNGAFHSMHLSDCQLDPKSEFLALDRLPAPVRAELRRLKKTGD